MKKDLEPTDMKVSVVIPAYNEEKYIGTLLKNLLKQTIAPDEVIVVDNNSTDKTVEIAKKYKTKIVHERRQGITYSRNTGFDSAKYDLIIRLDADTIPPRDYIERVKNIFQTEDVVAVSGNIKFYGLPSMLPTFWIEFPFTRSAKFMLSHDTLMGPNLAITKDVWKKVKNTLCAHKENIHEDIDLSIHLAKFGKIKFDPKLCVQASSRRIKHDPYSFFVEYSMMTLRTVLKHKAQFLSS